MSEIEAGILGRTREFEPDEVPMPEVRGGCMRCKVTPEDVAVGRVVVSPTGLAHFGGDWGDTTCGIDGTRDGWWWPL